MNFTKPTEDNDFKSEIIPLKENTYYKLINIPKSTKENPFLNYDKNSDDKTSSSWINNQNFVIVECDCFDNPNLTAINKDGFPDETKIFNVANAACNCFQDTLNKFIMTVKQRAMAMEHYFIDTSTKSLKLGDLMIVIEFENNKRPGKTTETDIYSYRLDEAGNMLNLKKLSTEQKILENMSTFKSKIKFHIKTKKNKATVYELRSIDDPIKNVSDFEWMKLRWKKENLIKVDLNTIDNIYVYNDIKRIYKNEKEIKRKI